MNKDLTAVELEITQHLNTTTVVLPHDVLDAIALMVIKTSEYKAGLVSSAVRNVLIRCNFIEECESIAL